MPSHRVIITFHGTVNRIDGPVAYISITCLMNKREGIADMETALLAAAGIGENDDFTLVITETDGEPSMQLTKLEPRRLTDEEVQHIWQKVQQLRDNDFGLT
jgi:hypothetical protein